MLKSFMKKILLFVLLPLVVNGKASANERPAIFPIPLYVEKTGGSLRLDNETVIIIPEEKSEADNFIAGLLLTEFGDRFRIPVNILETDKLPSNRQYILIGTLDNPLVGKYCEDNLLTDRVNELGEEGYVLLVNGRSAVVAAKTKRGALYGFQSFRQLLSKENNKIVLPQIKVEDKPQLPYRAIKLYLPGKNNLPFFKRFIRDFMAKYKFNTVVIEVNANMRLESHPELNVGTLNFAEDLNSSRRDRPAGPHKEFQNSSHQDNADGGILEKSEVAGLVKYIRQFDIEVIPEMPSLTHSYYLLFGHKNLAEIPEREYPDTYCPLKPENYKILFDVIDEYLEVFNPKMANIGHDEWRIEKDVCEICRGKDYGELFANDIKKIYGHLTEKGVKVSMWGDHLLESVRNKGFRVWETETGYKYKIPGAMSPEQVKKIIPKDILALNWFYSKGNGIDNDLKLAEFGFEQIYANFRTDIDYWDKRVKEVKGLLGGMPSSWAATTEFNFGKDQFYDFLGASNMLWSVHTQTHEQIAFITQALMPSIREDMSGKILPSKKGLPSVSVDISANYNSTLQSGIDSVNVAKILTGELRVGNKVFYLSPSGKRSAVVYSVDDKSKPKEVKGIKINEDVSSIIFLHASAREAVNAKAYKIIYNFDDTAELLGWYEVVYDDGFITTIPIRYGVNILDWDVHKRLISKEKANNSQNKYAYEAEIVPVSDENDKEPLTFFAYEWENLRPGKIIKEVNLKAVNYKSGHENAVVLLSVGIIRKKEAANAKGVEDQ